MLLRSLAAALWKDQNSRQIINADQKELYEEDHINNEDKATGYIYVLRTLSSDPKLSSIKDLFKIGYSSEPTVQRIKNASSDPTYLMADVAIVSEYQTYNLNPQKLELLLHKFFAKTCLNMDVYDDNGKRITPREWFVVPLHIIETAIHLLLSGDIVNYRYDEEKQTIVER